MEKFKYGIMVLHPNKTDENGNRLVVHFVGYWEKPTKVDFKHIKHELKNDSEFLFADIADELEYCLAPKEYVDFYNDICEADGVFKFTKIEKERLN